MYQLQKYLTLCKKYVLSRWIYVENNAIEGYFDKTQNGDKLSTDNKASLGPANTSFSYNLSELRSVDENVSQLQSSLPIYCLRPKTIEAAAAEFVSSFPGQVLYAIKCNSEPKTLQMLWNGGIRHFDCASIREIRTIKNMFPTAQIHFMHPVKDKKAIHDAYFTYGVRTFSLDSIDELDKIVAQTKNADDLSIFIRIKVAEDQTLYDLSRKFGASEAEAVEILQKARPIVKRLGICFHVGSQCMEPDCYENALSDVKEIIAKADVKIDVVDVGGGFPGSYVGCIPPPLSEFFVAIKSGFDDLNLPEGTELWCEPGRVLVFAGCSVVVKVIARKENVLYINDGVFGCLGEASDAVRQVFPMRLVRPNKSVTEDNKKLESFTVYGPTCDSYDVIGTPFELPHDVKVDDYIEIGQIGAYGIATGSSFNGFGEVEICLVNDDPLAPSPAD